MSVYVERLLEPCPVCRAHLQAVIERPDVQGGTTLLSVRCGVCRAEVWPPPDEPLVGTGEVRLEISAEESARFEAAARRVLGLEPTYSQSRSEAEGS